MTLLEGHYLDRDYRHMVPLSSKVDIVVNKIIRSQLDLTIKGLRDNIILLTLFCLHYQYDHKCHQLSL